jgi:hypothetical protein
MFKKYPALRGAGIPAGDKQKVLALIDKNADPAN